MRLSEFDYSLPKELIAQHPLPSRDSSRLMVLDRKNSAIDHSTFSNFPDYLRNGDLLVLNNTRVFPARLIGAKKDTGGKVELLLVQKTGSGIWKTMLKSSGKLTEKMELTFDLKDASAVLIGKERDRNGEDWWLVQFNSEESVKNLIDKTGLVPLPPYIKRDRRSSSLSDRERYQTVYASKNGAIAAPTAGLHFTEDVLHRLKTKGVDLAEITLHTGTGTFKPVKTELIAQHSMGAEYFHIDSSAENIITKAVKDGRRIIAVGTTTVRTLESIIINRNKIKQRCGYTDLFIYPGFNFKFVRALLTNFHLPKSTLLMLVAAFAGKKLAKKAYQEAIQKKYRFYSYGDAMFIS